MSFRKFAATILVINKSVAVCWMCNAVLRTYAPNLCCMITYCTLVHHCDRGSISKVQFSRGSTYLPESKPMVFTKTFDSKLAGLLRFEDQVHQCHSLQYLSVRHWHGMSAVLCPVKGPRSAFQANTPAVDWAACFQTQSHLSGGQFSESPSAARVWCQHKECTLSSSAAANVPFSGQRGGRYAINVKAAELKGAEDG